MALRGEIRLSFFRRAPLKIVFALACALASTAALAQQSAPAPDSTQTAPAPSNFTPTPGPYPFPPPATPPNAPTPQTGAQSSSPYPQTAPDLAPPSASTKKPPHRYTWPYPEKASDLKPTGSDTDVTLSSLPKNFLQDQKAIWTSPLHLQLNDVEWMAPFLATTGLLIASDHHTMTQLVKTNSTARQQSEDISNGGVAALAFVPAAMYLGSLISYSPHAQETGLLAGEAFVDSLVVGEVTKYIFQRQPPTVNNAHGDFFKTPDGSFPSNHSLAAWSLATVVAQEYPGIWTQLGVYSLATAVSISRITAYQHFPSDVLVGSVSGYLIGRYVYSAHHNETRTVEFSSASSVSHPERYAEVTYAPGSLSANAEGLRAEPAQYITAAPIQFDARGSVYVPMDSWVYPALVRLGGLGFIPSQDLLIRPWTRMECLRQINEAEANIEMVVSSDRTNAFQRAAAEQGLMLTRSLDEEFADETDHQREAALESIYSRDTYIGGRPLTRSWDFGQTIDNDYGRPYAEGNNYIGGYAVRATDGRFSFYNRQEWQHAPGYPNYSATTLDFIMNGFAEQNIDPPPPLGTPYPDIWQARPIELYAGTQVGAFDFTFGKQELYWGPAYDAPLSWSINADPTWNFQLQNTRPINLPWFMSDWGTYRVEFVVGKLSYHQYPERPWFNGQKITFNLFKDFDVGFTRWSVFFGVGVPATLDNLLRNIFSYSATTSGVDRGKRQSGFDFAYHVPFAHWITIYTDSFAGDEPNPIASPRRSAWMPGLFLSHIPGIPRLDFRFETPSTLLLGGDRGPIFLYWDHFYRDADLNKYNFVGNSVGRDGRQAGYRQTQRSPQLLPGAGTQSDALLRSNVELGKHWQAAAFVQYERYLEPIITPGATHNVTGQLQLTWTPRLRFAD
jgi:membrane-associated phospholipid phosphatase